MGREAKNKNGIPVVIGGMVLDIHSIASTPLSLKTTTPGKNEFIPGGVARNIAECLSKLGTKSFMISALGCDLPGDILLQQWKSTGLPVAGIQQGSNITTASVSNVFDTDGELIAGIASVESIERHVTPQWIRQFTSNVYSAPLVMVDANLTPEALQASCQMAADLDVPVWFEPVSVAKSKRIASIASHITFASPNEHELIAMANALTREDSFYPIQRAQDKAGASIETLFKELKPAILVLLQKEQYSYSTPYKGGSQLSVMHFPALPAMVGRVSGAGDCLVGGVIASLCSGLNIMQSVSVGIASAKAAIEVKYNVPEKYDLADIADNAGHVYNAAKILFLESRL